jgi:hypothetical protein
MPKYLYVAAVAASALVMAAPMASANAASVHVLTIKKVGGTAVKKGDLLTSGLAKGSTVKVTLSGETLTCKAATFQGKVTSNPTKHGKASESVTSQSLSKCTVNLTGITVKSVTASNLPYNATVSDSKGDPVKVSGRSKSKPITFTVTVLFEGSPFACSYSAASISGKASNKGNSLSFSGQKFKRVGTDALCKPSALFSATFGPLTDHSVKGHPRVFLN